MPYTIENLTADIFNTIRSRPQGMYSGRALGNSANAAMWTSDKIQQFYNGIVTAFNLFMTGMELTDFARLIVCECAQESTLSWDLGVKPVVLTDHTSQGIIQTTPGSVLLDYSNYGTPICDVTGKIVLNPRTVTSLDLADPGVCIIIWAFYNTNSVKMGVSMSEYENRIAWNIPVGGVTKVYANLMETWLSGPHNDVVKNPKSAQGFQDYYLRILDYYTVSGYGSKTEFDALLATPVNDNILAMYTTQNNTIDNRDTVFGTECIGVYP